MIIPQLYIPHSSDKTVLKVYPVDKLFYFTSHIVQIKRFVKVLKVDGMNPLVRKFYLIYSKEDGIYVGQTESIHYHLDIVRRIQKALKKVFPIVDLTPPSPPPIMSTCHMCLSMHILIRRMFS